MSHEQTHAENEKPHPSIAQSLSSVSVGSTLQDVSEARNHVCHVHGVSQTPHLDKQAQRPQAKAALRAMATALNDLADGNECTRCTVKTVATMLTKYVQDVREAKKNGQWTKEDKKALKAEVKGLAKIIKVEIKDDLALGK